MADATENGDAQKIPPKLTVRPRDDQPASGEDKAEEATAPKPATPPKTVRLRPPMAAAPAKPAAAEKKKQTTRIALEDAVRPAAPGQPQPSPLTPMAGQMGPAKPAVISAADGLSRESISEAEATASKRKTSRISLESVLGGGAGGEEGPKTIRLKRPSEAATVKMRQEAPVEPAPTVVVTPPGEDKAESQAEKPAETGAAEKTSTTRPRTIRVKRATTGVKIKKSGGAAKASAAAGEAPEAAAVEAVAPAATEDKPHWLFLVSEIAAVLVTCVLLYVFSAQAFGPDVSLTRLSYGARDLYLSWPGRVAPSR